jgi:hypothetical protein
MAHAAGQGSVGPVGRQRHLRNEARKACRDRGSVRQPPTIRTNLRGRTATHLALGVTDAGRKLTVAFVYYAETNTAYPITTWEQS